MKKIPTAAYIMNVEYIQHGLSNRSPIVAVARLIGLKNTIIPSFLESSGEVTGSLSADELICCLCYK
jgi:hypothetical protein